MQNKIEIPEHHSNTHLEKPSLSAQLQGLLSDLKVVDKEGKPVTVERFISSSDEDQKIASELKRRLAAHEFDDFLTLIIERFTKYLESPTIVYSMHTDLKYEIGNFMSEVDKMSKNAEDPRSKEYASVYMECWNNRLKKNRILPIGGAYKYLSTAEEFTFTPETEQYSLDMEKALSDYDHQDIEQKIQTTLITARFAQSVLHDIAQHKENLNVK